MITMHTFPAGDKCPPRPLDTSASPCLLSLPSRPLGPPSPHYSNGFPLSPCLFSFIIFPLSFWSFPGGSDGKESAWNQIRVWSLGGEDPLENEMASHCSILAWRMPWTEEPGGLQSMGSQRVRHNWATNILPLSFFTHHFPFVPFPLLKSTTSLSVLSTWECGRQLATASLLSACETCSLWLAMAHLDGWQAEGREIHLIPGRPSSRGLPTDQRFRRQIEVKPHIM